MPRNEAGPRRLAAPLGRGALRALPLALLGLCALLSGAGLAACSFDYGTGEAAAEAGPSAVFTKFTHTVVIRGARLLEIRADRAESYDVEGKTLLYGVSFTEFDEKSHEAIAEGRADRGVIYTQSENAEFSGSIALRSKSEDASLKAESLSWDSKAKSLSSRLDQSVELRKGDGTWLKGAGFSADMRRKSFAFRDSTEGAFVAGEAK